MKQECLSREGADKGAQCVSVGWRLKAAATAGGGGGDGANTAVKTGSDTSTGRDQR